MYRSDHRHSGWIDRAARFPKEDYTDVKIYILVIEHEHGRDIYPCASDERAWQRLDEYVSEWWDDTRGRIASERVDPTAGDLASMTRQERIETYFDYWSSEQIECWEIEEYEVLE
jgi:hypothetical protein